MRRPSCTTPLLLALVALLAPAGPLGASEMSREALAPRSDLGPGLDPVLVFYPLEGELRTMEGSLTFEISADGEILAREQVRLPGVSDSKILSCGIGDTAAEASAVADEALFEAFPGEPVDAVEILARHPDLLSEIHHRTDRGDRVDLRVFADGKVVAEAAFEDVRAQSDHLRTGDLVPRATSSGLLTPSPAATGRTPLFAPLTTCQLDCESEYSACELGCGNFPSCIDECDSSYSQCLADCSGGGGCTPSTRDYTVTTLGMIQYFGQFICQERQPLSGEGLVHEKARQKAKVTFYRETTHCDGTKTTEVLHVSYGPWTYCWAESLQACAPYWSAGTYFVCPKYS
ncbi:MAG: hypothetical protein KDD11_13440 [Acidobacteria bacterium]|nr:hypothetical protein [Acidobacteriota bacterium]